MKFLCFLTLFLLQTWATLPSRPNLVPYPQTISFSVASQPIDPCKVEFKFKSESFLDSIPCYYGKIIDFFLTTTFPGLKCHYEIKGRSFKPRWSNNKLKIKIANVEDHLPSYVDFDTDESYTLDLNEDKWVLEAQNYVGFLRGFETFLQLIEKVNGEYQISHFPIQISDSPSLKYRGVMIDTARHYMKVSTLKHVLDGMVYHKLNVLHWHITDEESFPLVLESFPELTQYGAYSPEEVYTKEDVEEILLHARLRGIRVIPEIDSPAHSLSWGWSPALQGISMHCFMWALYNGQLNPTLDKTYQVVEGILNDLENLFPDPIVHLGGDEVGFSCWENDVNIRAFMDANNIPNGIKLQQYYKTRQRDILSQINPEKSAIYWVNDANFDYLPNDIQQFWSSTDQYSLIQNYTNRVILSPYDYLYIDLGYGNIFGDRSWAPFVEWKKIYNFNPYPAEIDRSRILGSEVTLWAELNSDAAMDNHLWSRTSAFSERVWNALIHNGNQDIVTRLYANEKRLLKRGIAASPVTSEHCARHVEICWPDN